jgi:hypothetical protein
VDILSVPTGLRGTIVADIKPESFVGVPAGRSLSGRTAGRCWSTMRARVST